jgi:hypothetical protein
MDIGGLAKLSKESLILVVAILGFMVRARMPFPLNLRKACLYSVFRFFDRRVRSNARKAGSVPTRGAKPPRNAVRSSD